MSTLNEPGALALLARIVETEGGSVSIEPSFILEGDDTRRVVRVRVTINVHDVEIDGEGGSITDAVAAITGKAHCALRLFVPEGI